MKTIYYPLLAILVVLSGIYINVEKSSRVVQEPRELSAKEKVEMIITRLISNPSAFSDYVVTKDMSDNIEIKAKKDNLKITYRKNGSDEWLQIDTSTASVIGKPSTGKVIMASYTEDRKKPLKEIKSLFNAQRGVWQDRYEELLTEMARE